MNVVILLFRWSLLTSCETNLLLTAESAETSCVFRHQREQFPPPRKMCQEEENKWWTGNIFFLFQSKTHETFICDLPLNTVAPPPAPPPPTSSVLQWNRDIFILLFLYFSDFTCKIFSILFSFNFCWMFYIALCVFLQVRLNVDK